MSARQDWTRRTVLAAGIASGFGAAARAAATAPRVAALDWGWASTLLAIGIDPVGVAERRSYADWVGEPALPAATAELGLRTTPNLEALAALRPDLILTNSLNAAMRPQLERIAPTLDSPIFTDTRTPLANARSATHVLGDRLDRREAADRWIAECDRGFAAARERLAPCRGRPLVPLQMLDRRHVTYYGAGSLYGDVLQALDLRSAFPGPTSLWGHHSDDVASLAALPAADLLLVAPLPPGSPAFLEGPSLMASLVAAGHRRVYRLPPAWVFGELTAAARFARLVADALVPQKVGGTEPRPGRASNA